MVWESPPGYRRGGLRAGSPHQDKGEGASVLGVPTRIKETPPLSWWGLRVPTRIKQRGPVVWESPPG